MKNFWKLSLVLLVIMIGAGCKKSNPVNNNNNNNPVTHPDTLSSGWSKVTVGNLSNVPGGGDISFLNQQEGFICIGDGGMFKTLNGGLTWTNTSNQRGTNMAATQDNKVFTVTNLSGSIYRSDDGGQTYTTAGFPGVTANDIFFRDNNTGYCSTNLSLLKTSDGGMNWNTIANPNQIGNLTRNFIPVYSIPGLTCLGYGRYIYISRDNDLTWQFDSIPQLPPDLNISAISVPSASVIYIITVSGYLCKSVDAGVTFSMIKKFDNTDFRTTGDVVFVDVNNGYVSQDSRIWKTVNGGNSWTLVAALGSAGINEIDFVDANHGWAFCMDGTVLRLVN